MKKWFVSIAICILIVPVHSAEADSLALKPCLKVDAKIYSGGKILTCSKVGNSLLWKSRSGKTATPVPVRTKSATPKPKPSVVKPVFVRPQVGSCYNLTVEEIEPISSAKKPVPCSNTHTSVTFSVSSWNYEESPYELGPEDLYLLVKSFCGAPPFPPNSILNAYIFFYAPENAWNSGDRWIRCDMVAVDKSLKTFNVIPWRGAPPFINEELAPSV
jgi:hypothetical protein